METNYIGKKVIVRCDRAGVFYGTLKEKDGQEACLTNVRRLWYWDGAASLSQMAVEGVSKPRECKFTIRVPEMIVEQVIEMIPCTKQAVASLEAVAEWKR